MCVVNVFSWFLKFLELRDFVDLELKLLECGGLIIGIEIFYIGFDF